MLKQLGTFVVCGALLMSTGTVMAQAYNQDHPSHGHGKPAYHGMYDQGRHEGWYKKGGRVPSNYRGGSYVVTNWHSEHLRQPPHGYNWVRSDNGDFLLVAVTTGVIASIIAASH